MGLGRAVAAPAACRAGGRRSPPQPREHGAGAGALPTCRHDSRPHLPRSPGGALRPPVARDARARPARGTARRSDHRAVARARAATSSSFSGVSRGQGRCRSRGRDVPDSVPAVPRPSRADASALGGRAILLSASAKRPHKNLARLLDALALVPPARRPILVLPRLPDAARGGAPCACGRDRRRC